MPRSTELAHLLLRQRLHPGDFVVDATVGNGHDTRFLAECVGPHGRVFGFDMQEVALAQARLRLTDLPQVTLINTGHERMAAQVPLETHGHLAAVMFNLGYLPGSSKKIITRAETTIAALQQALNVLAPSGLVTIIVYRGHEGGTEEADAVRAFASQPTSLFAAHSFGRLNATRPTPELIVIERMPQHVRSTGDTA